MRTKATLIKASNSNEFQIPYLAIQKALEKKQNIVLKIVKEGLLLKQNVKHPRTGWAEHTKKIIEKNKGKKDEGVFWDFINDDSLVDESELEWE